MTTITTRVGKGSPLTIEELDDNFINLNTDIVALQANAQAQQETIAELQGSSNVAATNANVTAANARIATLDANLGTATTNITALFANAATQATALTTLTANAATQSGDIATLFANAATQQSSIDRMPTLYAYVHNAEGATISKGQPVYLFGATGDKPSVKLAFNTGDATSAKTLGLAAETLTTGAEGWIIVQGQLVGVDTSAYSEGATLYLGATAGTLTATKPYAPNHLVYTGVVSKANAGAGSIYIRVQNGYELDEIHDVQILSGSQANNDVLMYDSNLGLWRNKTIGNLKANLSLATVATTGSYNDLTDKPSAGGTYTDANVAAYLPTYTGSLGASSSIVDLYANAATQAGSIVSLTANAAAQASDIVGLYSNAATQSSAIAGKADTASLASVATSGSYNDLSNRPTLYADSNVTAVLAGSITVGNITSTNGYFWANGTPYSSGSGGGGTFSGDLAGSMLYDSVRNRTFANAYPLSTPDLTINNGGLAQFIDYAPVYTSGVLAAPTSTNTNQTLAAVITGNVSLRSSYQTSNNRSTSLNSNYLQVWMNTANTMTNSDRIRSGNFIAEVKAVSQTWGGNTAQYTNTAIMGVSGVGMFTGNGTATSVVGLGGFAQYTPASGGIYSRVATGVMGAVNINTTGTGRGPVYVEMARSFGAFMSGTGGNVTIGTAVGLHTHSGWATATTKYALLNEDTTSAIRTLGNIEISGTNRGILFNDGSIQTSAPATGVYALSSTSHTASAGTVATLGNIQVAFSSSNVPQIGPTTGTLNYGVSLVKNLAGTITGATGSGSSISTLTDINNASAMTGFMDVTTAIINDQTGSRVYRATWTRTSTVSDGIAHIALERLS